MNSLPTRRHRMVPPPRLFANGRRPHPPLRRRVGRQAAGVGLLTARGDCPCLFSHPSRAQGFHPLDQWTLTAHVAHY